MAIGPSTTTAPYILGYEPNVHFTSIITAGDSLPGSTTGIFAGTPDGGGAFDNGDGTFTLLINHEFNLSEGIARDHGGVGSYVDELIISKADLSIISGHDLIQNVYLYNTTTGNYDLTSNVSFSRFCSSDLAVQSAFYNATSGLGTQSRIYMTGEEDSSTGKAIAVIATGADKGSAYELARFGNAQWENLLANPFSGDKTIVIGQQDGTSNGLENHVFVYIGDKMATGSDIDKAGLTDGSLFAVQINGVVDETNTTDVTGGATFNLVQVAADASNLDGAATSAAAEAAGATSFLRPEDGAWDPTNPNRYYFVTTNSFSGPSRLWALDFTDLQHPELGGTVTELLSGTEGQHMFDNITVDAQTGHVILQEDPGNNAYVAQMYDYDPATDTLTTIAGFNPAQFMPGAANFITQDEESSGVFDVTSILGSATTHAYLLTGQVHAGNANPAIVEGGQLMVMYVDDVQTEGSKDDDVLNGSAADEHFNGEAGNDIINAGSGDDFLNGGKGDDTLNGGAGNDTLEGGNGHDILNGGAGDDVLNGGQGDDVLIGGLGIDLFNGGAGADTFVFDVHDSLFAAQDKIQGFSSGQGDKIDLTAFHITAADLVISHGQGNAYVAAVDLDHDGSFDFGLTVITKAPLSVADFVL